MTNYYSDLLPGPKNLDRTGFCKIKNVVFLNAVQQLLCAKQGKLFFLSRLAPDKVNLYLNFSQGSLWQQCWWGCGGSTVSACLE